MAKKVIGELKLQLPAGKATPAPPVGPALGQRGINIMEFVKAFNAKTADKVGMIIPVVITVYADRSFSFILKTPPASILIKKAAGKEKGSSVPNKDKVGKITKKQVQEMVRLILGFESIPKPDHAADALSAAICLAVHDSTNARIHGL